MAKKLKSIFTDEEGMNRCMFTGKTVNVERHHVFEGLQGFKKRSEELGFIAPLDRTIHKGAFMALDANWSDIDHWLKRMCQEWYIEVAQIGTREDWYREFGKFYDDRTDEDVPLNGTWVWDLRRYGSGRL